MGLDQLNNVQLHGFQMSRPVDDSNVKQFKRELSGASDLIAAAVSGEVAHRPTRVEVGGVQGFRLQVGGAIGDQAVTFTGFALVQGKRTSTSWPACPRRTTLATSVRDASR